MLALRPQRTLAAPVSVEGFGFWSDQDVRVTFRPAAPNEGKVFVREDLPGKPRIPASDSFQVEKPLRTCLVRGEAYVEMVEHILAALAGMRVDNCEIHVTAAEMPGMDGSALPFVEALEQVGYENQDVPIQLRIVSEPFRLEGKSGCWVEVSPARGKTPIWTYELDYPHCPAIGRQTASLEITPETFRQEIAPCRTFTTWDEANQIRAAGLARRTTLQDVLVFGEKGPLENETRFPNECARHKILDMLGDWALGGVFDADIRGYRSGHALNVQCLRALRERKEKQ